MEEEDRVDWVDRGNPEGSQKKDSNGYDPNYRTNSSDSRRCATKGKK